MIHIVDLSDRDELRKVPAEVLLLTIRRLFQSMTVHDLLTQHPQCFAAIKDALRESPYSDWVGRDFGALYAELFDFHAELHNKFTELADKAEQEKEEEV